MSDWSDKPAGAHGFVEARGGHLFAGEKRIRFFGVNVAFGGNFPTHPDAEKIAARMAKFGINCVRFHHMDTGITPNGLLQKDKRTLDPEMLDRLDYFIAQLKKNGIYTDLNLHVGREYPGFKKWEGAPGYFKGVDNFFPPMIALQHEYAQALLTHLNPYTGMAYTDEPAVAFVEINNENGLMNEWNNKALDAMPDPYAADLRRQWNEWLSKKYGSDQKLAASWNQDANAGSADISPRLGEINIFQRKEITSRPPAAQRDWHRFLFDTEMGYWTGMRQFIRDELHAHSLVVGSAAGYSPWPIQAMLDVVDAHAYWQHPHFPHRPWDPNDWTVNNIPMAGEPNGGTLPGLAMMRVADKPFIVTEYNHPAPNTYSSEAFLELCAVAALQDWDGVFAFAYSHRMDQWDAERIPNFFDIDQHPTKMTTLPAAVALFLRGDIQAPEPHIAETTLDDAVELVDKSNSWSNASAYGIRRGETFQHPVAMRIGNATTPVSLVAKSETSGIASDNGELTWDPTSRRMLIKSPKSVCVVGTLHSGETIDLGGVSIIPGATLQNWAALTVTVMEGADFKTATRLLVTATGSVENTDMHWKDASRNSVGSDYGKAPSRLEGIPATITLSLSGKYKAWALDERGARKSEVPLKSGNGTLSIELSPEQKTLWWEIAAEGLDAKK
ncbi:MAG: beta-galactosidase [Methylacidiphilales bacterium]|nr:beta-galactosidase [Candidatus Methylacidiphilales bacterium]